MQDLSGTLHLSRKPDVSTAVLNLKNATESLNSNIKVTLEVRRFHLLTDTFS